MSLKHKIIQGLQKNLPRFKMVDEYALMQTAHKILEQQEIIDHSVINLLTQQYGCDLSTAVLYAYFQKTNKSFIEAINQITILQKPTSFPQTFIIIPALLHEMYPAMGGKGELFGQICKKYGHQVHYLETNGGKNVVDTSKQIRSVVERHERVWLISISRGGLDVLNYLAEHETVPKNIAGWVNVGGLINGSPLSNHILSTPGKRLKAKIMSQLCDVDYSTIADLKTQKCSKIHQIPFINQLSPIHIVGFPLRSHIPPYLISRYLKLANEAPNDAMLFLTDYIGCIGNIYPLWGCDHFFRFPNMSSFIHQLMSYLEGLFLYAQTSQKCFDHHR